MLFIKGDDISNVRLSKFLRYCEENKIKTEVWGWNRNRDNVVNTYNAKIRYLLQGGGYGGKVFLLYPVWMLILFFNLLFKKSFKDSTIFSINFDAALPVYLVSKIRRFDFIYEIRDEISISYNFPSIIASLIEKIDHLLMRSAKLVIHVDKNRIRYNKCNYVVIENSPYDYYQGVDIVQTKKENSFAVVGLLTIHRGLNEIIQFASDNPDIKLVVAGKSQDEVLMKNLKNLKNVECYNFMPQIELYDKIKHCRGIFSLYDPTLEINRLAASNKVYDAMMLGIPVITNKEVINSTFIKEHKVGIIVNYKYDASWDILTDKSSSSLLDEIGINGRELFMKKYNFPELIRKNLKDVL